MATTEAPPVALKKPSPAPADPAKRLRFVDIRADLMPDEVISARRTEVVRRRVLLGLGLVVALLIAGYGSSWLQTHSVKSDLSSLDRSNAALQSEQSDFAKLVTTENSANTVQSQLRTLMAGDLPWSSMLQKIHRALPSGTSVTSVQGSVPSTLSGGGGAATTVNPLNQSGEQQVGTLTLTGAAPSKSAVAKYADNLGRITGVAAATPTSVATTSGSLTYTITALITSSALGGRYAAPAAPSAAGTPAPAGSSATTGGN